MFGSIGKALNQITGATNSSNAAFSQSRMLANMSYAQQKEFAQNAHQWEMQDLQKAGLNPALTTGASSAGSIAGGGSTGNSGNVGSGNLLDVVGMINNTRLTNAQIKQMGAQTDNIDEDTENKEWENKFWKWGEDGINWFKNLFNNDNKNNKNKNDTNSAKKQVFTKNMLLGE